MNGESPVLRKGAVVLCGGRGERMGRDKASLPFGEETLLQRVVRLVGACVPDVVVAARPGQELPPLPEGVRVVFDETPDSGPLAGLAAALAASPADAVFATSCDAPFVSAAVIELLFERLGKNEAAVAVADGHVQPLSAVYRTRLAPKIEMLVATGQLRTHRLFDVVPTTRVAEAELRAVDPELLCLVDCDTPQDYAAALSRLAPGP